LRRCHANYHLPDLACSWMAGLLEWGGMTGHSRPQSRWSERLRSRGSWFILLAVLALVAAIRIRLLQFPLERDEGEYAYAAS